MFTVIIFICTVVVTALLSVFTGVVNHWYDFYFVILFFIGAFAACSLLYMIIIYITTLFIKVKDEPNEHYSKRARFIMDEFLVTLCHYARIKIIVKNRELLPEKGRFLIVSNHLSDFDPIVTNVAFKGKEISWIAKKSLFKVPYAGPYMYRCNFLAMDRNDVRQSLRTINKAAEYIKDDIVSIGIYPEGTRNTTEDLLLPFKPGALKIAQKANVPIVVMTIVNTQNVKKRFPFRRTRVYIDLLKVYSSQEIAQSNTNDLTAEIEGLMRENIVQANQRKK